MAAQSIASRRTRRPHEPEPNDAVLERALQFSDWAKRNIIGIAIAAVAVFLVLGGLLWYRTNEERQTEEAAIAFLQLEQAVQSGDETIAMRSLETFIGEHGDTPYGDEARVLLGQIHVRTNQPTQAITLLQPIADRMNDSPVGPQAALLLASAQEAAGQTAEAIQTYLTVGTEADTEFRRQEGMVGAALLRQATGDYAGAAEIFQQLIDETEENSFDRSVYEMRYTEAAALAASPPSQIPEAAPATPAPAAPATQPADAPVVTPSAEPAAPPPAQ